MMKLSANTTSRSLSDMRRLFYFGPEDPTRDAHCVKLGAGLKFQESHISMFKDNTHYHQPCHSEDFLYRQVS